MYEIITWVPVAEIDAHMNTLNSVVTKYINSCVNVKDVIVLNEINQYCESKCLVKCEDKIELMNIVYINDLNPKTPSSDIYACAVNGNEILVRDPPKQKGYALTIEPIPGQSYYFGTIAQTPYRSLTNIKIDIPPSLYSSDKPYKPLPKNEIRAKQQTFINQLYNSNTIFGIRKDYGIEDYDKNVEMKLEHVYAMDINDLQLRNGLILVANYHLPMEILFIPLQSHTGITQDDINKVKQFLEDEERHARYFHEFLDK